MIKKKPFLPEEYQENDWEEEWVGMPEFIQNDLTSKKQIIVHFRSIEDMNDFAKLVKQRITYKTKAIWYPEATIIIHEDKKYKDES